MLCSINAPIIADLFNSTTVKGAVDAMYEVAAETVGGPLEEFPYHELDSMMSSLINGPFYCLSNGKVITLATRIAELRGGKEACFCDATQAVAKNQIYSALFLDGDLVRPTTRFTTKLIPAIVISTVVIGTVIKVTDRLAPSVRPFVGRNLSRACTLCGRAFARLNSGERVVVVSGVCALVAGSVMYAANLFA
jgi:hypothetical protein